MTLPTERHTFVPPPVITIENDGPRLVNTSYWQTENCARGLFYLSTNAGTTRLLVPPNQEHQIREMRTAFEVVQTLGRLSDEPNQGRVVEVMFEDGSDSPFCIYIEEKQIDRLWTVKDQKKSWTFSVYTQTGAIDQLWPMYLRTYAMLPYGRRRGT